MSHAASSELRQEFFDDSACVYDSWEGVASETSRRRSSFHYTRSSEIIDFMGAFHEQISQRSAAAGRDR